jgi:hypothetical protein
MHACEVHAHEVHAREVHAREIHAHEVHAHEVHAHEVHHIAVRDEDYHGTTLFRSETSCKLLLLGPLAMSSRCFLPLLSATSSTSSSFRSTTLLTHPLLNGVIRGRFVVLVPVHPFLRIGERSILVIELAQKVIQVCIRSASSVYELSSHMSLMFIGRDG